MGYGYSSTGALCCDNCGNPGGVRKRKCTEKVLGDSLHGSRVSMHYCYPPALCGPCLKALGGQSALHKNCKEAAAKAQADYDEIERQLDAGESFPVAAWGSWQANVPDGQVGVKYRSRNGESYVLMGAADYDRHPRPVLSSVQTTPWSGPDGQPITTDPPR